MSTTRIITADDLLVMPHRDRHGNDCRLELIHGEVKTASLNSMAHGVLCVRLATAVSNFVEAHELGVVFATGTGFLVEQNPDTVYGVDVAFVSHKRLKAVNNLEKFIPFAPDLAIEVLGMNDTIYEMDEKIAFYFAAGSRLVCIINPKRRTVAVYTSTLDVRIFDGSDTLDGGDVLPGFKLELSRLFANLK